jgi:hypothetical protein
LYRFFSFGMDLAEKKNGEILSWIMAYYVKPNRKGIIYPSTIQTILATELQFTSLPSLPLSLRRRLRKAISGIVSTTWSRNARKVGAAHACLRYVGHIVLNHNLIAYRFSTLHYIYKYVILSIPVQSPTVRYSFWTHDGFNFWPIRNKIV